jgi:diguanylate cyclase (GGDEF)-like protein
MMKSKRKIISIRIGFFLLLYLLAGELSIQLGTINPGNMAIVWLAAGIGLFAVLQLKKMGIALVFAGSLILNTPYLFHGDWQNQIARIAIIGILFALIDTLQSLIAARAYVRLEKAHGTQLWAQPILLPKIWIDVCLIPAALSMPLFIVLMVMSDLIPSDQHSILLRSVILLLADTSGLLLLTPLYPYLKAGTLFKEFRRVFWYLIAILPPIFINYFVLDRMLTLLLPLMLFIAVRFRMAATNFALLLVTQLSIGLTAQGYGFWTPQNLVISLLQIQVFTFSITLALQYLAQTQTQITQHKEQLEIEVQSRTESLAALNAELTALATTDELTQLPNRREWQLKASQAILQARRYQKELSVMMIDVDHFKKVNDDYGHLIGDLVLKDIAKIAKKSIRGPDSVARWGGEEFVILLPETDHHQALIVAEKLRLTIAQFNHTLSNKTQFNVTVSIGITALMPSDSTLDEVLSRADQAMYAAKTAGRNCVRSAQFISSNYLKPTK